MEIPLVSIVISCYNTAQFVEQAVLSAVGQTYANKEIIVVDDGSDAATKKVLQRLEPLLKKLISQENKGQSAARNAGIASAKGKYILILDSDDYFENSFLEKAVPVIESDKNVKVVTCQANLVFEDSITDIYYPRGGTISNFLYSNGALGTSLFSKNAWSEAGGYDESMRHGLEDWEFFIRILTNGGKVAVVQEPLYNYRKGHLSTTVIANKNKRTNLAYIFKKHRKLYAGDYDNFVDHMLSRLEYLENDKEKATAKIDFKIGQLLLKPFRMARKYLKR